MHTKECAATGVCVKGGHQRHLITGQLATSREIRYTNICNQCGHVLTCGSLSFLKCSFSLSASSQALFHHYATCEEHSSLLSVVGGVGYNSIGLVEGLAHQTHLQHVNDDGKEVICVPAISGPGTWASSPTATSTLVSTDVFPLDSFSLGMRTQSGTQTCVQNRLHTTCCHSNTSYPHPIPYPAHKQTTYVETLTVQDKYKTIHLTPSHLPPKSAVYAPLPPSPPLIHSCFSYIAPTHSHSHPL